MRTPILLAAVSLVLAGCANKNSGPTTRPASADKPAERAKKDPFGYSPNFSDTEMGGVRDPEFDRDGLKKDLGHVIMP